MTRNSTLAWQPAPTIVPATPDHEFYSAERSAGPWQRPGFRLIVVAGLGLIVAVAAIATGITQTPRPEAAHPVLVRPHVADDSMAENLLSRFALNALLANLIDDDTPPRWNDVAVQQFCLPGTRVEVNGEPMVAGARLPATAFTLRWHMSQCWPFDYASVELSGSVGLLVFHEDEGFSAIVSADRLRIEGHGGFRRFAQPFAGALALTTVGPSP